MENEYRSGFETFKSNICHRVKDLGDIPFLLDVLQTDDIKRYFDKEFYREGFYVLAMVDYLCREHNIPLCKYYDYYRNCKLKEILYPEGIKILAYALKDNKILEDSWTNAIPEFKRFNIVENEVRNVI